MATKFKSDYYAGGVRVLLGGVPCRIARMPEAGGIELLKESSRRMRSDYWTENEYRDTRARKRARLAREARERAAYEAAPKHGEMFP